MKRAYLICILFFLISLPTTNISADTCTSSGTINFSVGWNLVSFKGLPDSISNAQDLLNSLMDSNITASHGAKWGSVGWSIYQHGLPFNNFAIEEQKGYMIRCMSGGSWSYTSMVSDCTPEQTQTPCPTYPPTGTPRPTYTPRETFTPYPTYTLYPTYTPYPTATPTATNSPIPAGNAYVFDNIVGGMRYVPAGTFTQGSPMSEACRNADETQFTHQLTRNIAVMETEITRRMWADLQGVQSTLPNDPTYTNYGPGMTYPVNEVTWQEAVLFANLLSIENGLTPCYYTDEGFTTLLDSTNYITDDVYCDFDANGYRLLTEGEWEYTARAGTTGPFSCDEPEYDAMSCIECGIPTSLLTLQQHAVFCLNSGIVSKPVGSKLANPWNLRDMHGNINEWCWDWYGIYPGDTTDYTGPDIGVKRVVRSGSFGWNAFGIRSAVRNQFDFSMGNDDIGFRLCRTIPGCELNGPTCTPTPTPTPTATHTQLPPGNLYAVDNIVGNMRYVPAGTFTQGSPGSEGCRGGDEAQFTHQLTRNIAVMETEISQSTWNALKAVQIDLPALQSYFSGTDLPVDSVTWYETILFANLLSLENGLTPCYYRDAGFNTVVDATNYQNDDHHCNFDANGYRLPAEGEWEYFCRAGTTTPFSVFVSDYSSGTCSSPDCQLVEFSALQGVAWYCTNSSNTTHAIGTKSANPWNLKDVHGNVYEWCWDWEATYPSGSQQDYTGASGSYRVKRGGGWSKRATACRSASRYHGNPGNRGNNVGFRLCRTIERYLPTFTPTDTPTPTQTPTDTPTPTATPTPTPEPTGGTNAGDLYVVDSIVGNMRYVPAGSFTQGSPGGEACRDSDESQFNHILTRNIAVMETEITRRMWADLQGVQSNLPNDPTNTTYGSGMTNPVNSVTWFEAVLFANLLSIENGLTPCYYTDPSFTTILNYITDDVYCDFDANGYRLLTEGEWEYSCRAGTTGPFSCSELDYDGTTCSTCDSPGTLAILEQHAVFCMNDNNRSEPVGSKLANPWNLKDIHGNVWEWCWDWDETYPGDTTDYAGAASGWYRVLRGGGWNNSARLCRSAQRYDITPYDSNYYIGFRLCRTLP